jgi:hypothetical protein
MIVSSQTFQSTKWNPSELCLAGMQKMWDFRFSRRRVWNFESCGMWRRVVTLKLTDVSEVHTASIIIIALMMEAVRTSETSVNFNVTTRRCIPEDIKILCIKCQLSTASVRRKQTFSRSSLSPSSGRSSRHVKPSDSIATLVCSSLHTENLLPRNIKK